MNPAADQEGEDAERAGKRPANDSSFEPARAAMDPAVDPSGQLLFALQAGKENAAFQSSENWCQAELPSPIATRN